MPLDRSIDAAPRSTLVRDRATWALYLLLALFAFLETCIGPAMPFIRSKLDIGYTLASLHFSAFATGAILCGVAGDRIVSRIGRRVALWGGLAGMALGAVLLALSPTVAGTILGVFAMGFIGTLALMANQSSLSDLHGEKRTIALTESNVAASSAAVAAPLAVGGFDAAGLGWQVALMVGLPILALLFWRFGSAQFPPAKAAVHHDDNDKRLPALFWIYWSVLFMVASVEWCVAFWGADFLDSVVGLSKANAATAMSIFFVAMVAGRAVGARLARRRPGSQLLAWAIVVALVGFPIYWLSANPVLSLVGLFIAGFGIANFYPLAVAAGASAAADRADTATARLAISGGGALLIGPLLVGIISDAVGMRWGFGIVVPLLIGALVATLHGLRVAAQLTTSTATTIGQIPAHDV